MDGAGCGGQSAAPPSAATGGSAAGTPTMLPPGSNIPNFQAPPQAPAQMPTGPAAPAQMPTGPAAPTTGYLPYPTGVQAAGYPGYAPLPWMQPQGYPTYWNPAYPPYGR